jgi:hypothetical protein
MQDRSRRSSLHEATLDPDPVIELYKQDVDRTLLRENLKLTVEERLQKLMRLQRFAEEMRRAGLRASRMFEAEPLRPKDFEAISELEALRGEHAE